MLPLPAGREARPGVGASVYVRHRPERILLYQLVQNTTARSYRIWRHRAHCCRTVCNADFRISSTVAVLNTVSCECAATPVVPNASWPPVANRGFCPSCCVRRMAASAALLVDEVFPEQPVRQWVLSP